MRKFAEFRVNKPSSRQVRIETGIIVHDLSDGECDTQTDYMGWKVAYRMP